MKKGQKKVIDIVPTPEPGAEVAPADEKTGRLKAFEFSISFDYLATQVFGGKAGIGNRSKLIDLMRYCEDKEIRNVVALWDDLATSKRSKTTIESLCERADVECRWVFGALAMTMYELGTDASRLIAGVNLPAVTRKLAEFAQEPENHHHAKMFLQGAGFLPRNQNQFALVVNNGPQQPEQSAPKPAGYGHITSVEDENNQDSQFESKE